MTCQVTKRLGGYPCCHRQWRDEGHCSFLHGYDRWIELTWEGERDERGWVVDFGGLTDIKNWLDHMYDHTTLLADDDPYLATFEALAKANVVDLRVTDPTMEGMALTVAEFVNNWTTETHPNAKLIRVQCWENEKNSAVWTR